jgi:hypothetical protein
MNGPDHYLEAERLLKHASEMLDTDVAPEDRAELVTRQAAAAMATAHALLAVAASTGLSAHLDSLDTQAWRDAAATTSRAEGSNTLRMPEGYASAMSPRRVRGRTTAPTRSPGSGTRRPGDRVRGA